MQKSDIKESLAHTGFVSTDLNSGARITATGPEILGPVGQKTHVRVEKDGETLHNSKHSNSTTAARKYVELAKEYSDT